MPLNCYPFRENGRWIKCIPYMLVLPLTGPQAVAVIGLQRGDGCDEHEDGDRDFDVGC